MTPIKPEGIGESVSGPESVVYLVSIGRHVKIGHTRDLRARLQKFATSTTEPIQVLATIPGGRAEESRLHRSLAEAKVRGEFFRLEYRLENFIAFVRAGRSEEAWDWLDRTHPEQRVRQRDEARRNRDAQARRSKAEKDAYFAGLVAERKRNLGW